MLANQMHDFILFFSFEILDWLVRMIVKKKNNAKLETSHLKYKNMILFIVFASLKKTRLDPI